METSRGLVKELEGIVVSAKMQKTVVLEVSAHVKHPKYGKYYVQKSKFAAHDENSVAGLGDLVKVRETRPLSKTKRWKIVSVVRKAPEDVLLAPVVVSKPAKASAVKAKSVAVASKKKGSVS